MNKRNFNKQSWPKVQVLGKTSHQKGLIGVLTPVFAMCLVTLLMLGAIEGFSRLVGWGNSDPDASVLYYQQIKYPLFQPVELVNGQKVYQALDGRLGSQQFPVEKDPGSFRVFVFGGSATNGLGFSPNGTFSHYLGDYLREIYPELNFEIINVGVIGFSSKQVKGLVNQVNKHYQPDLLVIYSGNNEFLELHARMFMDRALNARLLQVQDFLHSFQTYRGLKTAIQGLQAGGKPGGKGSDEKFARFAFSESELMADIHVTPAEYKFILKKYRKNIGEMIANAQDTPLLLLTVASNLRWNDPDDMQVNWVENYLQDRGVALAKIKNTPQAKINLLALSFLEEDLRNVQSGGKNSFSMDVDQIYFRMGKVFESLGNFDRALESFEKARDFDKRSRRSLGAFNQVILEYGEELKSTAPHVQVIDSEHFLREHAPNGIIGYDSFYDYVHFTPLGAQRVAEAVSRRIVDKGIIPQIKPQVSQAKFFDYQLYQEKYAQAIEQREVDFPEADRWLGFNFDKGEIHSVNLFKYREGIESLEKMLALGRNNPWIYTFLGNASFHNLRQDKEALNYYRQALRLLGPEDQILRWALLDNMAKLYDRQGDVQEGNRARTLAHSLQTRKSRSSEVALDKYLKLQ